jgi:hybrid cluster-associated redox disulfide protein
MAITKNTTIGDAVNKHPKTAQVMLKYGLHCAGCSVAAWETIEQGAKRHGLDNKEIDKMVLEMNKVLVKAGKKKN